jgi:hypothetical protein
MSQERRQYVRIDKAALVAYEKIGSLNDEVVDASMARTLDVSVQGLAMEFAHPVAKGDHLRIELLLDGVVVKVEGVVVRVSPLHGGMTPAGVHLTHVPAEYVGRIEGLAHS